MFLYLRGMKRIESLLDYLKFANEDDLSLIWIDFSMKIIRLKEIYENGIPGENLPPIIHNEDMMRIEMKDGMILCDKELEKIEMLNYNYSSLLNRLDEKDCEKFDLCVIDTKSVFQKHILDFPLSRQIEIINFIGGILCALFYQCHIHTSLKKKFNLFINELNKNKNPEKLLYISDILLPEEIARNTKMIKAGLGYSLFTDESDLISDELYSKEYANINIKKLNKYIIEYLF